MCDRQNFTKCDRCILNLVRPHLIQAEENNPECSQIQQILTQFKQALDRGGAIGLANDAEVRFMTQGAEQLLSQYCLPHAPHSLPEPLQNWFKHQMLQLTHNDDVPSSCLPLHIEKAGRQLIVRLIPDPIGEQYLLLLEERELPSISIATLELLGLTQREAEVLFWVAKDKSNAAIAKVLGCCEGTVRKHLEHHCMNFDILAHELGHSIVFSQVGFPENQSSATNEYWGFHESAGDVVALISLLHFDKVVSYLLDQSKGNLFTVNELSRLGELSQSSEIRGAFNYERMSTVGSEEHDLSQPLTGALFDIFVEVFQKELVKSGLIDQALADLSYHGPEEPVDDSLIQDKFDLAYVGKEIEFKSALFRARDYWGELLAKTWSSLSPNNLYYASVVSLLLSTDVNLTGGEHQETIRECFVWREISFPGDSIAFRSFYVSDLHLD